MCFAQWGDVTPSEDVPTGRLTFLLLTTTPPPKKNNNQQRRPGSFCYCCLCSATGGGGGGHVSRPGGRCQGSNPAFFTNWLCDRFTCMSFSSSSGNRRRVMPTSRSRGDRGRTWWEVPAVSVSCRPQTVRQFGQMHLLCLLARGQERKSGSPEADQHVL